MQRLLLVDDEKNMLTVLDLLFRQAGYAVDTAESAEAALELAGRQPPDMVVSDLKLPGIDGIRFLRELRQRRVMVPFVLVTAFGTVDKAVEIMKLGAVDVLTKPFAKETVLEVVARSLAAANAPAAGGDAGRGPGADFLSGAASAGGGLGEAEIRTLDGLVWTSPTMDALASLMRKVGPVSLPVLLTGESGTGKDVAARALHQLYAAGKARPFVAVNCPAMPEHLLESELFGYRRGAFTGASHDYRGKVEQADGGTLFFDEIGDLPLAIQPKLLRLLENRSFDALGSGQTRQVDIRVVCATNRDLRAMVREGRFREDLYYRINTFTLELPPLRERCEDIPVLAAHFLRGAAERLSRPLPRLSASAATALASHDWPGNVRELRNVVERALVLAGGPEIGLEDIPAELRAATGRPDGRGWNQEQAAVQGTGAIADSSGGPASTLDATERRLIAEALAGCAGNVSAAARRLGISRNTLRYRMQKHGLDE